MKFEQPSGEEQREKEPLSVDKILERVILLHSMKNWLGEFMMRHAEGEELEKPLETREDFFATITRDRKAAEDRGDIESAAALEEMTKRFQDERNIPLEAQKMDEIIATLREECERMKKLAFKDIQNE